ncbi:MAG: DNA polymerase III subunit delta [Chloroflexi bacterium RBG_16_50_11]|nr:MAG: DNA polymerase III subunit delta [Chloroflexi bacterium RBG_16_50_11]
MLHVLIGEDDFSVRQALEAIKKSLGDPAALMPNTTVLEGGKVTPEQLRAVCETVPFLADKRLVIVEGLLEKFQPKGKNGKKKSSRQPDPAEACRPIAAVIKNLPHFTELVLLGGGVKAINPLLREISSVAKVKNFPMLKPGELSRWIEQRVASQVKGSRISKQAVDLMVRLVGNDLWTMANEVDKLVLYTAGRSIEEDDVRAVVSHAQEAGIFNMVDAIMESRVSSAQPLLQQLFTQGMEPAYILVMLARQVRIIFQMKEMRGSGRSRSDIQTKLGLTNDFVLRKAWEQADKYSPLRLKEVYHKLLEADVAIKTGKYGSPELVLDILIAELGQRGAVSV